MAQDNKGKLAPEDAALWQHVTRSIDKKLAREQAAKPKVRRSAKKPNLNLQKRTKPLRPDPVTEQLVKESVTSPRPTAQFEVIEKSQAVSRGRLPGLDRRSALKLQRGQLQIESRLDLHGMTQNEARRALDIFLAKSSKSGKRCVLVITGKGTLRHNETPGEEPKSGILRTLVPNWLGTLTSRTYVLAYHPAQPKDGGAGALYVMLRRRRRQAGSS